MKKQSSVSKILLGFLLIIINNSLHAQVKIGDNPNTINSNSLLEMESSNKGILPPRVAINSLTSVSPLTGTVPAGMLVYSSGGSVADGYYYWNGSNWSSVGKNNLVTKTADATLNKSETFVLGSNDIVLTLPAITNADNGFAVTIKNIGTHTDLVVIKGNGSATIDGIDSSSLTRWFSRTYVAYNGNWITKEKETGLANILDVSPTGSWTTIEEAIEFLSVHMTGPSVIRLSGGTYEISTTQIIDMDYPLTIQGTSFGKTTISPASGLSGPLFRAQTEAYFKMLAFDGTAVSGYANTTGNDAIQFEGSDEYFEVKDCNFDGFNKGLVLETNSEVWVFETDFNNSFSSGITVASAVSGVTLKVSEVDFISCAKGIHLSSGSNATVSILNSTFYNSSGGIGLDYDATNFTSFSSMFITNNAWNGTGSFFNGFDFSRADGRDAKAFIQNNAGDPDRNPSCYINVLNNATSSGTLTNANAWYKAAWNHALATVNTTKWTVANASGNVNRITYQPVNKRSGHFIVTGSLSCNNSSRTISISVFKNGNTAVRFGEITVRTGSSNTPTPFSFIAFIPELANGDYFEIGLSSTNGGDVITIQDLQWIVDTK